MFTLPKQPAFWVYQETDFGSSYLLAAFQSLDDAKHYAGEKPFACSIWQGKGNDVPAEKVPVSS